jgi:hypothetical protein
LRLLRDATAAGLLKWEQGDDSDWFHADSAAYSDYIQFRYPSYNDGFGSDRDYVQVGRVGRFMIGTPGWWLVLEILAAGIPEWADHLRAIRAGMEADIRRLSQTLEQGPAGPSATPDPAGR